MDSSITTEEKTIVDGHEYVDLGLPDGALWATCNIGANSPEEFGDYFAWGETQPKESYGTVSYKHCKDRMDSLTKYCKDSYYGHWGFTDKLTELLPEDDAATANSWRSREEDHKQQQWPEHFLASGRLPPRNMPGRCWTTWQLLVEYASI